MKERCTPGSVNLSSSNSGQEKSGITVPLPYFLSANTDIVKVPEFLTQNLFLDVVIDFKVHCKYDVKICKNGCPGMPWSLEGESSKKRSGEELTGHLWAFTLMATQHHHAVAFCRLLVAQRAVLVEEHEDAHLVGGNLETFGQGLLTKSMRERMHGKAQATGH